MEIHANLAEFTDVLNAAQEELDQMIKKVVVAILSELAKRTVQKTPVEEGTAAMNWQVAREESGEEVDPDATGGIEAAVEAMVEKLGNVNFNPPEAIYWLYNNLDYIQTLEFGLYERDSEKVSGGFSIKAPQGMLRITIEEITAEAEEIIQKAIRGE